MIKKYRIFGILFNIFIFWIISVPILNYYIYQFIESKNEQLLISDYPTVGAIVVLGGGVTPPEIGYKEIDLNAASDRVWYASRLFKAGKAPILVLSGGGDITKNSFSEAYAMSIFMQDLGVDKDYIILENKSKNTKENALYSFEILNDIGVSKILLVTSAIHMHRALTEFQSFGLQVIPAPTDFYSNKLPPNGLFSWLPDISVLNRNYSSLKEYFFYIFLN